MNPIDPCELWSQRSLVREEVGSTTVAGAVRALCAYGEGIGFLMASVYSHRRSRQEVRDVRELTDPLQAPCSSIEMCDTRRVTWTRSRLCHEEIMSFRWIRFAC
jgi:hypothetical protein